MSSSQQTLSYHSQRKYTQWCPIGYSREECGSLIQGLVIPKMSWYYSGYFDDHPSYERIEQANRRVFQDRLAAKKVLEAKKARHQDLIDYIRHRKIKQMGRDLTENMHAVPLRTQTPFDSYGFRYTTKSQIIGLNSDIFVRYWQSNFRWFDLASYKDYLAEFDRVRYWFIKENNADSYQVRVSLKPLPPVLFYYWRNEHIQDHVRTCNKQVQASYRLTANYFKWIQSNPSRRFATLKQYRLYVINKLNKK